MIVVEQNDPLWYVYMAVKIFRGLLSFAILVYILFGILLFLIFIKFLIDNYSPRIGTYIIITIFIILLTYIKGYSDCDGNKTSLELYKDRVFRLFNFFYFIPLKIIFAFLCIYFLFSYLFWSLSFWFEITIPNNYYPIIMILVILFCLNSMYFFQIFIGFIIYYYAKKIFSRNKKRIKNYKNDYSKYNDNNSDEYKYNVLNVYYGDKNDGFNDLIKPDSEGKTKMDEDEALKRVIRGAAEEGSDYRRKITKEKVKTLIEMQKESDIIGLTYDPAFRGYVVDSFMLINSYMYFINHKKKLINLEKLDNLYTIKSSDDDYDADVGEFDFKTKLINKINDKHNQTEIQSDSSMLFVKKRLNKLILNNEGKNDDFKTLLQEHIQEAREHAMKTYNVDEATVIKIEKVALSINAKPYSGMTVPQTDLINELLYKKDPSIKFIATYPHTLFKLLKSFNDIGLLDYFDNFIELSKYKKNNGYKSKMILLIVVLIISTLFLFYFDNGLYFIHNIMNPDNIINYSDKNMFGLGIFIFFILTCLYLFDILKTYIDKPDTSKKLSIEIRDYNSFPGFPYISFLNGWGQKTDGVWEQFLTMLLKLFIFIFCSPPFISVFIAVMYNLLNITMVG